ncbi:cold-shock protein [Gordonia lacunae]
MSTTGTVQTWHQELGWGVIESDRTPGGAFATSAAIRGEAVADLTGFPMMGLRPGTEVEFEWSEGETPVDGCSHVAHLVWPPGESPPAPAGGAYSGALWNSVGEPGPDGLTVMRQRMIDDADVPPTESPALPSVTGSVRTWHDNEGWGVLDSEATPGGAWAFFAEIDGSGYRSLTPGQRVRFDYEDRGQDGYDYRARNIRTVE